MMYLTYVCTYKYISYGEINEAAILSTSSDPISILTPSILSDIRTETERYPILYCKECKEDTLKIINGRVNFS